MANHRLRCVSLILFFGSLGFLITAIVLFAIKDSIIENAVKKETQLKQGTFLYEIWQNSPAPLSIAFYVFDLTNENEFVNGAKPHFIQRGPFVYKEQRTKSNIKFYSNGTISYQESRNYSFDRSRSVADESFEIKTVNIVYMTLINYLQEKGVPDTIRSILERLLSVTEKLIMQRTVREYLWGYEDPLLKSLKELLPQLIRDDEISVFAMVANEAQYETFLINDGVGFDENHYERVDRVGWIERFNFSSNLAIWFDPYANMINGTDSTIWHPNVDKEQPIYSFMNDICRSVYVKYNRTYENSFKISTYRFELPEDLFSNSSENQGFCPRKILNNGSETIQCLPNGLFYLTPCLHLSGSSLDIPIPIVASNPHFLFADRSIQESVEGLMPDETLHRSFMDIEPITGVIMNGSRRMQFNLNVVNDSRISSLMRVRPVVFPMMWVHEFAEIDQANAVMFHEKVLMPIETLHVIKFVFLALGFVLLLISISLFVYRRREQPETAAPVVADETTPLIT